MNQRTQTRLARCVSALLGIAMLLTGCGGTTDGQMHNAGHSTAQAAETLNLITPTSEITELEEGFSTVRFDGDYGFDSFLSQGGAASDAEVVSYLANSVLSGWRPDGLLGDVFGCSTVAVRNATGDALFGRNFDWQNCEAMVVESHPETGYASFSTVNMDFITQNASGMVGMALNFDEVKTLAALYAPLDGMNEAGLAVSVNMIQDSAVIDQNTDKPDITTTTAIRLLLDKAGDVEEALALLEQYDLHASMGMVVHFAIADAAGRSVVVEYVDNEMAVTETPVVTNFYLAEGDKQSVGTQQSHERYEILTDLINQTSQLEMEEVRDALDSVSKDNFEEFASTEWSIVMNLSAGEARYYHRENYSQNYTFRLDT